jgi:hypothetical protein
MVIILILASALLLCTIAFIRLFFERREYDVQYFFDEKSPDKIEIRELTIRDGDNKLIHDYLKKHLFKDDLIYYGFNERHNVNDILLDCKGESVPARKEFKTRLVSTRDGFSDTQTGVFGVGLVIGAMLGICGIICIHNHSSYALAKKQIEIDERITELEASKQVFLSYYDAGVPKDIDISSMNLPEKIKEHNANVRRFVEDVKIGRIREDNIFINWFVTPIYKTIDISRIEATYVILK